MAKKAVTPLLLFLALFVVVVAAAAAEAEAHHRPQSNDPTAAAAHAKRHNKDATPTHLHFFFHDTVSGKSPTAIRVVDPPASSSSSSSPFSMFGMVNVMDDPLTEGPELDSGPVGRAQGLYMASDQNTIGFLQAMNLVFTSGDYNGSTLALLGRNCPLDDVRELPIVGGTGAFRFARGYALLHTHWLDFHTGDATVEYNVYVMH